MPAIWEPNEDKLRGVPDEGVDVEEEEDASRSRDEAEEGPPTKGAVRARGEVSVAVQGVQRLSAREVALSVQGVRWVCKSASTVVCALCKECGGSAICEHGRVRSTCKDCGGHQSGDLRARSSALVYARSGGSQICEHGRRRSRCKECRAAN